MEELLQIFSLSKATSTSTNSLKYMHSLEGRWSPGLSRGAGRHTFHPWSLSKRVNAGKQSFPQEKERGKSQLADIFISRCTCQEPWNQYFTKKAEAVKGSFADRLSLLWLLNSRPTGTWSTIIYIVQKTTGLYHSLPQEYRHLQIWECSSDQWQDKKGGKTSLGVLKAKQPPNLQRQLSKRNRSHKLISAGTAYLFQCWRFHTLKTHFLYSAHTASV